MVFCVDWNSILSDGSLKLLGIICAARSNIGWNSFWSHGSYFNYCSILKYLWIFPRHILTTSKLHSRTNQKWMIDLIHKISMIEGWLGAVHKLCRLSRGRGGQKLKLPILHSKKMTKRGAGGQKLPILRWHSLWTAPYCMETYKNRQI